MPVNSLSCFITMEEKSSLSKSQQSSSLPLFPLIDFFLIGFFRWVSFAQIIFYRFWSLIQHQQCDSERKSKDLKFSDQLHRKFDDDDDELCRQDAEMVMKSLGLFDDPESEGLQERYSSKELSKLFEEKEPSLEEVKQAFDVFDENRDGFIDEKDLQRVLTILGLKQGSNLENCKSMIRLFDENKDGRIDFYEFVKFMEKSF